MTRRWQVAAVVVLAGACTRPNPAYDGGTDDDPTVGPGPTATDSSIGTDPSPTTADTLTTRGTSTTEGGEGSTLGTTVSVDDTSAGTTAGETTETETGAGVGCMPEDAYDVTVDGAPLGPCGGVESYYVAPMEAAIDGVLMGNVCAGTGDCSCARAPQQLSFEGPLPSGGPLPANPSECFILQVQRSEAAPCSLLAYAIIEIGGTVAVGSNVPNPMVQEPFGFVLGNALAEPCPDPCAGAGRYPLVSAEQVLEVPPDGLPVEATVGATTFEVVNLGSGIMPPGDGASCVEVGRWQAVAVP